jgi:hypothetical protein
MAIKTTEQLASFPWIVSCDTLRTEDLLVKFWSAAEQIGADLTDLLPDLQRLVGEDSSESDWNDEQACHTLESLTDRLQDAAPTGFYFGASEGDGACFGFWLSDAWSEAMDHLGFGNDDPTGWAELISRLDADGIEPDSIEDAYQGRAEGYSEESAGADFAQELADSNGLVSRMEEWPVSCIDWADAWRELTLGDGFRLHDIGGGEWLVFRNV